MGLPHRLYTAARYDNPRYHKLVNLLVDLQEKWDFALLDLWHDTAFNALSPEERALYMNDAIHPTRGRLPAVVAAPVPKNPDRGAGKRMISKSGCCGIRFLLAFCTGRFGRFRTKLHLFLPQISLLIFVNELVFAIPLWYNRRWKRSDKEGV